MSKHILRKHLHGFTTVSNNVIKVLKGNLPALGLYLYILSLPNDWEFYKTELAKSCQIGIKKLEKLLRELSEFGLVQYGQKRDENGRFTQFYMHVYDTETLKNKDLHEEEEVTTLPISPEGQNCRTAETVRRFGEATKEVLTKEELIIQNKNKSFCVSRISKAEKPKPKALAKNPIHNTGSQYSGSPQQKEDNKKQHDFAQMMNEKASIERSNEFKRMVIPHEFKAIMQKLKRRSMVNS